MIVALDYDDTYTRDPIFWARVVGLAVERGHSVICVTKRDKNHAIDPTHEPPLPANVEVVYAGAQWKQEAALAAGYAVHVWIDDMPGLIQPPGMLDWRG